MIMRISKMFVIACIISALPNSFLRAIPQNLAPLSEVAQAHGLIYGGPTGYQWKAIELYQKETKELQGDAWEKKIVHIIERLHERVGLRVEEKVNIVLELIAPNYKSLSPEVVYNMLVNMVYDRDQQKAFNLIQRLEYNDIYQYINTCHHDPTEGVDAVRCD
ncbi:MAG: hypothetical protein WCE21_05915 [Candidatus Babeliales bacterium]